MRLCGGDDKICPPASSVPSRIRDGYYTVDYSCNMCPPGKGIKWPTCNEVEIPAAVLFTILSPIFKQSCQPHGFLSTQWIIYLCICAPFLLPRPLHTAYSSLQLYCISKPHKWYQIFTIYGTGRWRNVSGLGFDPAQIPSSCSHSFSVASPTFRDFSSIPTSDSVPDCQLCPLGTYKSTRSVQYPILTESNWTSLRLICSNGPFYCDNFSIRCSHLLSSRIILFCSILIQSSFLSVYSQL